MVGGEPSFFAVKIYFHYSGALLVICKDVHQCPEI